MVGELRWGMEICLCMRSQEWINKKMFNQAWKRIAFPLIQVKVIAYSSLMVPESRTQQCLSENDKPSWTSCLPNVDSCQNTIWSGEDLLRCFINPLIDIQMWFFNLSNSSNRHQVASIQIQWEVPECIPREVWMLGPFPKSIKLWSTHISIFTHPNQSGSLPVDHLNSNPRRRLWQRTHLTKKFIWGMVG